MEFQVKDVWAIKDEIDHNQRARSWKWDQQKLEQQGDYFSAGWYKFGRMLTPGVDADE